MYALKTIRESKSINYSFKCHHDHGDDTDLVICRKFELEAYSFTNESPFLNFKAEHTFRNEIEAAQIVKDRNGVLVLTGGAIKLMVTENGKWVSLVHIPIQRVPQHQRTLEGRPSILCRKKHEEHIALIHEHLGFITLVNLGQLIHPSKKLDKKTKKKFPISKTINIGNIVVKLMCWLGKDDLTFAVLYRDFEFNHSLRFYKVDPYTFSITLESQKLEFKDAPSLVFEVAGGVLVASGRALYFFSRKDVYLDDKEGTSVFPVSQNSLQSVVTLDLSGDGSPFVGSAFQAHTLIENKSLDFSVAYQERHLLVTDSGQTALVYLKALTEYENIILNNFLVLDLGKSTIATGLAHIESNVFFAASRLSQSVLFRILEFEPHIHVFGFLQSSPPVLDIAIARSQYEDMVVALGGFYSGELEKFTEKEIRIKAQTLVSLPLIALYADLGPITREGFKFTATGFQNSYEYSVKSEGDKSSIEQLHEKDKKQEGVLTATCADGSVVSVNGDIISYQEAQTKIPGLNDPCSLSILELGPEIDLVVCLTSNVVYKLRYVPSISNFELLLENRMCYSGTISATLFPIKQDRLMTVTVSSTGDVNQSAENILLNSRISGVIGCMRVKSCGTKNPRLLMFDSIHVWMLMKDPHGDFLTRTLMTVSPTPISDCLIVGDEYEGDILLFCGTEEVNICSYEKIPVSELVKDKYYSCNTVVKSLIMMNTKYLVTIELRMDPKRDRTGDKMVSRTILKLYDRQMLKELHSYGPLPASNYADLCELENTDDNKYNYPVFVVADNNKRMLYQFSIQDLRIVPTGATPYQSLMPDSHGHKSAISAVQLLSCTNGILTLVGDRLVQLIVKLRNKPTLLPVRDSPTLSFGIGYAKLSGLGFLGDAMNGILLDLGKGQPLAPVGLSTHKASFLTAIAALESKKLIVYGDSVGNLAGLRVHDKKAKVIFAINLGDQINVIKALDGESAKLAIGTCGGAVYTMVDIGPRDRPEIEETPVFWLDSFRSWRSMDNKEEDDEVFGVLHNVKVADKEHLSGTAYYTVNKLLHDLRWSGIDK